MAGTKKHRASEAKVRRTREKGQVASSREIVHALAVVVLIELVIHLLPTWSSMLRETVGDTLDRAAGDPARWPLLSVPTLTAAGGIAAMALVPAIVVAALAGLRANDFLFAPKALVPDFQKIDPVSSMKAQYGPQGLARNGLLALKLAILLPVGALMLHASLPAIAASWRAPGWAGPQVLEALLVPFLRMGEAILLVFGVVDVWVARIMHQREIRMDDEEFRRDYREAFGDPLVRGRQRAFANELLNAEPGLSAGVEADVVFTNPTHRAVGLVYRKGVDRAPRVVFKQADAAAQDAIRRARGRRVAIVRSPAFTRALYDDAVPGRTVPSQYWRPLAMVYRMLRELDRETDRSDIEVPAAVLLAELAVRSDARPGRSETAGRSAAPRPPEDRP